MFRFERSAFCDRMLWMVDKKNGPYYVLIFSLCIPICDCSQPRPSSMPMCLNQKDPDIDCSFQLKSRNVSRCRIYSTDVCKSYNFSSWNLQPFSRPSSESDVPISVSIDPYPAIVHNITTISAINITVNVLNKDIDGFSFSLTNDVPHTNICRIFDLRDSLNVLPIPVTLYYDCWNLLVEKLIQNVTLTFRVYPLNLEFSYFVYIPSIYFKSVCEWRPLVMIFQDALPEFYIQAKFTNAPEDKNISSYNVGLLDYADKEIQTLQIFSKNDKDMISFHFFAFKNGYYSISINIVTLNGISCTVYKSQPFYVGNNIKDYYFITLLIIVLICTSVCICCYWKHHPHQAKSSRVKLLIVYSHDCLLHKQFLDAYFKNLKESFPDIMINSIYGYDGMSDLWMKSNDSEIAKQTNPNFWFEEMYSKSDIIVFIISEGLFHKFDHGNIPPLVKDIWEYQLNTAVKWMENDKDATEKKFCKVCFPYSKVEFIPKSVKIKGKLFMLPKKEQEFLCYIFGCSKTFCFRKNTKPCNHKMKIITKEDVKKYLRDLEKAVAQKEYLDYETNTEKKVSQTENKESSNDSLVPKEAFSSISRDLLKYVPISKEEIQDLQFSEEKIGLIEDPMRNEIHNIYYK